MLRLASYDIVFREVPGHVSLALNISGCPNDCPGCHSPHLRQGAGERLDGELVAWLLDNYGRSVTCVCFMGGDGDPRAVAELADIVRADSRGRLKTAWYSGRDELPTGVDPGRFDFIKLGPYIPQRGPLDCPDTNQRFYTVEGGRLTDRTHLFW